MISGFKSLAAASSARLRNPIPGTGLKALAKAFPTRLLNLMPLALFTLRFLFSSLTCGWGSGLTRGVAACGCDTSHMVAILRSAAGFIIVLSASISCIISFLRCSDSELSLNSSSSFVISCFLS